ncbi:MAG: hypothetical protein V3W28_06685 [Thermoplasmata archaeon]
MADNDAQLDDVGTIIRLTITDTAGTAIDVSSATTQEIILRKPDGTVVTKTSVFTTDGTDGKIEYVTIADDLDAVGSWQAQANIVLPSEAWRSAVASFRVRANL